MSLFPARAVATGKGIMARDSAEDRIDAERLRLIDSIYEAVLRPEHYDSFMADWAAHLDRAAARLGELRIGSGPESRTLDDPLIAAHFRRAFEMLERMGRGPAAAGAQRLTDTSAQPSVVLGADGALRHAAPDAATILGPQAEDPAVLDRALAPDSALRLRAMLAGMRRAPVVGQLAVLTLAEPEAGGPGLLVARTRRDARGGVELAVSPLVLRWSAAVAAALAGSFRLTPRELELVRDLAEGLDLATMAAAGGRSLNTLRAQLKSVFHKTRTGSQADLLRLVAALILYSPEPGDPVPAEPATDWGRQRSIPGHDGQPVPVHLIGPEDGRPVMFVHGMLDGVAVTRRIGRALAEAGLRLIAPVRRNFGQAPPDPRVREAPEVFARDAEAVLAALGPGRVVLLGHMAGAVPAFAAAARLGARAAGLVNVSGGVPIRSVRQFALMSPRQRAVAYTARFAPALLPAILRAGIAQIDGQDAAAFMAALYPEGSRDREVVADPEIAAAIIEGYRFSVAQGEQAFRIDSWHVTRDWSELADRCPCPVRLIHGADDRVVHPRSVQDFAQEPDRRGRVTLDLVEGKGQLLFYVDPGRVLGAVARAFGD